MLSAMTSKENTKQSAAVKAISAPSKDNRTAVLSQSSAAFVAGYFEPFGLPADFVQAVIESRPATPASL